MEIKPKFNWDPEHGVATCIVINPETECKFVGIAECHPEDKDMMNEMTGQEIAYHRALINLYRDKLKTLKKEKRVTDDIYKTFKNMPNFDKENRYIRVVRHRSYGLAEEIRVYSEMIENTIKYIKDYIDNKDQFYKITRRNRKLEEFKQED